MNLKEILIEITLDLSNAYEYEFVGGASWKYNFEISTGTKYSVIFKHTLKDKRDYYERMYYTTNIGNPVALTNENQALKVNATVMKITLDFLEKNKDWREIFISPLSPGRYKLVKVLLDKNLPSKYFYDEIEENGEIKIYRKHKGLKEFEEFGKHLFGDKDSGVKIGWYKKELEPDTSAETTLFDFLKKYADSEESKYSTLNLDNYIPIFKKIKKQYPEIGDPKIGGYIYRGTTISKDKLKKLLKEPNKDLKGQNIIIPNQEYTSRRQASSWSINYHTAAVFALSTSERKNEIPVVMRAKAKDAELFFTPKFMNKLSNQLEDETFNITNPIPVDIMVIKEHEDEFQDIEKNYLHNKKDGKTV